MVNQCLGENANTYGGTRTPWHTRKTGLSHGLRMQRIPLNLYKFLHNSDGFHARLRPLGKNGHGFLLFTAYTAPVERRFQGSGVGA